MWKHFGFYADERTGKLDYTYTVCKLCKVQRKYCGNTSNMREHIVRWHPELLMEGGNKENPFVAGEPRSSFSNQTTITGTLPKLHSSSQRATRITKSIGLFIAKDLRPYSVWRTRDSSVCCRLYKHVTLCRLGNISISVHGGQNQT